MQNSKISLVERSIDDLWQMLHVDYAKEGITLDETYSFLEVLTNLINLIKNVRIEIIHHKHLDNHEENLNYIKTNLSFLDELAYKLRRYEREFEDIMLDKQYIENESLADDLKKDLDAISVRNNHLSYYSLWARIRVQSTDIAKQYIKLHQREESLSNEYIRIADSIDGTAWNYHIDSRLTRDNVESKVSAAKALHQDCKRLVDDINKTGIDVWSMLESRYYSEDLSLYKKPSLSEYITYLNWKYRYGILNEISILAIGAGTTLESYKRIIEWMNKTPNPTMDRSNNAMYN